MLFHRIDYIDTHGFLSNLWRLDANSASTVASRLTELGMVDVRIEPVQIPLGDPLQFKQWLNSNPNSPNLKEHVMQQTTYPSGVTVTTEGEHATMSLPAGDKRQEEMVQPMAWPEVGEPMAPATKTTNPKDAIGDTKVPLWLLSTVSKIQWAMAQFAGLTKYGAWNWRVAGVRASVYLSAAERHLEAYKSGEELDPVDGTHHLGNVMACCAILLDAKAAGMLTDDRPPRVDHRSTLKDAEELMAKLKAQYADKNPRHYTIADTGLKA